MPAMRRNDAAQPRCCRRVPVLEVEDFGMRGGSAGALGKFVGDSSKARERLGWEPTVRFHALIQMMVEADLERHAGTT